MYGDRINYRYILEKYDSRKRNRYRCPRCGRDKCFTRYVDKYGEYSFPEHVGKCDHDNTCGYHLKPGEYFQNERVEPPKTHLRPDIKYRTPSIYMNMSTLSMDYVKDSIAHNMESSLAIYLSKIFGKDRVKQVFDEYCVGGHEKFSNPSLGRSVAYWQVDTLDRVRSGKIMMYDYYGHRVKKPFSMMTWAHSVLGQKPYNLVQCLFGEHLLKEKPTVPILLVESEKTALIMRMLTDKVLPLATGGIGLLSAARTKALRRCPTILLPDLGAYEKWEAAMEEMQQSGVPVWISDALEKRATAAAREKGLDAADWILMKGRTKTEIIKFIAEIISQQGLEIPKINSIFVQNFTESFSDSNDH